MSLSTLAAGTRLSSRLRLPATSMMLVRYGSYHHRQLYDGTIDVTKEGAAKFKVQLPGNPTGHYHYERSVSHDPRYKYQIPGNTIRRFIFGRIKEEKGLWGLYFAIFVVCPALIVVFSIWSFLKIEVLIDHRYFGAHNLGDRENRSPFDWDKIRNNYWKKPTQMFYRDTCNVRLPEMEALQDAMLEESIRRGKYKTVAFQNKTAEHH